MSQARGLGDGLVAVLVAIGTTFCNTYFSSTPLHNGASLEEMPTNAPAKYAAEHALWHLCLCGAILEQTATNAIAEHLQRVTCTPHKHSDDVQTLSLVLTSTSRCARLATQ